MELSNRVSDAINAFTSGDYAAALKIYKHLASKFGENLFSANIFLCEKRISASGVTEPGLNAAPPTDDQKCSSYDPTYVQHSDFPRHIKLCSAAEAEVLLRDEPVWFEFSVTDADFVQVAIDIRFNEIQSNEVKKALLLLEIFDVNGHLLPGPHRGFTRSDTVGWFKYLIPSNKAGERFIDIHACQGASKIRLGLRSFYTENKEQVFVGNDIALKWHNNRNDNQPDDRTPKVPLLPCLPFELPKSPTSTKPRVASILDPFSHACFEPECDLVPVSPSGWRRELIDKQIDFILVESAWSGNDSSWLYRVASYKKPPGDELKDIIRWARKFGVPTVFWNKEDPPNFDRFIERAADFDYIFTTDENCIERYRKRVGSGRFVEALPFAAQPRIHNPIINQPRLDATSFAGTYYADDFEPRRNAMAMLLRSSVRYGLDIFDRMNNVDIKDRGRYLFPADLQQFIRCSLSYSEMIEAYRRYRVALNVNSVSDSPTMFSRRVFELLACGTPVISTESLGIDRVFNGLVPTVENESEAIECLDRLMLNTGEWIRTSVKGTRAVFSEHTYRHRIGTIARAIGISIPSSTRAVVALVHTSGNPLQLVQMLKQQREKPAAIVVIGSPSAEQVVERWVSVLKGCDTPVIAIPIANVTSYLRSRQPGSLVAFMDGNRYYGPSYLLDARISLEGATSESVSGVSLRHALNTTSERLTFEDARTIGMPVQDADIGSLVLSADHSGLQDALTYFSFENLRVSFLVRSRSPFDFLPKYSGQHVPDSVDLA